MYPKTKLSLCTARPRLGFTYPLGPPTQLTSHRIYPGILALGTCHEGGNSLKGITDATLLEVESILVTPFDTASVRVVSRLEAMLKSRASPAK